MRKLLIVSMLTMVLTPVLILAIQVIDLERNGWELDFLNSHGEVAGEFEGVKIYSHDSSVRGNFGLRYQCVEFVNRFYVKKLGHKNMEKAGHADSYFWNTANKGLVSYLNGGREPPKKYDILVFDGGPKDGGYGHVGIIASVDLKSGNLELAQQNAKMRTNRGGIPFSRAQPRVTLKVTQPKRGGWFVQSGKAANLPVVGWSRRPSRKKEK